MMVAALLLTQDVLTLDLSNKTKLSVAAGTTVSVPWSVLTIERSTCIRLRRVSYANFYIISNSIQLFEDSSTQVVVSQVNSSQQSGSCTSNTDRFHPESGTRKHRNIADATKRGC